MSDAEARQSRPAAIAREPFTGWHRAVERLNIETDELAEAAFAAGETAGARQFVWAPLRTFVAALLRPAQGSMRSWAILAGYRQVACAAKLWEEEMRWRNRHLETIERGAASASCGGEWRDVVEPLFGAKRTGHSLSGGRGGTSRIATEQETPQLRRLRRGGAMRWLGDLLRPASATASGICDPAAGAAA